MLKKPFGLAVRIILPDENDNILLLKRSPNSKTNPGKWELPGGKVDQGESFDQALLREVLEETGLKITIEEPVGVAKQYLPFINAVHLILTGKIESGSIILSNEHDDYKWVPRNDVKPLPLADWLIPFIEQYSG